MNLQRLRAPIEAVGPLDVFVSAVALFSIAISQPILDLLGKNPEFFIASSSPPSDVFMVGLVLALLAPVLLGLLIVAIRRYHLMIGTLAHLGVLGLLTMILVVDIVESGPWLIRLRWTLLLGLLGGSAVVALFYWSSGFRFLMKVVSLGPLVVMASFMFFSGASKLLFPADTLTGPIGVTVGNAVPIVIVVFDEFPVASIIDGEGNLQAHNYPGLARLAADGTWFRNMVSNETNTARALPALLTGAPAIRQGTAPIASDYPFNLFTLLGGIYEVEAIEAVTELCPEALCMAVALETRGERWSSTLDDLWIIGRHVWLPAAFTKDLPPIDRSWSDFGAQRVQEQEQEYDILDRFRAELDKDRRQEQVDVFLDHLGPAGERPSLDFAHFLLPHAPWKYLPDGRRHGARGSPGTIGNGWGGDEWLVDQAYQKHLLQIQYADQVVGRVIDRLTTLGVYEKSLIVVVADHGIAFGTEIEERRRMDAGVVGDVAAVPLFIKLPDGEGGLIDDYRAELIDVLPTIAAVLEVTVPWSVEGTSLIGTDRPVRETSLIDASLEIGTGGGEKLKVAQRKIDSFGDGDVFGLAPPGTRDLLRISISDLTIRPAGEFVGRIQDAELYEGIDTKAQTIPAAIRGSLEFVAEDDAPALVAISVNGVISAVTRSYVRGDEVLFEAILPPEVLVDGHNDVRLILIRERGEQRILDFITGG